MGEATASGEGETLSVEVELFVRAEAAGVVIGKQGFVLQQIRRQSGAKIYLRKEEEEGLRPCQISGPLKNVLDAQKHVFELVRAVPVRQVHRGSDSAGSKAFASGPDLPRSRISPEPVNGKIVSWRGKVGWIQPNQDIDHPQAGMRKGRIYIHEKDVAEPLRGLLKPGQKVVFYV